MRRRAPKPPRSTRWYASARESTRVHTGCDGAGRAASRLGGVRTATPSARERRSHELAVHPSIPEGPGSVSGAPNLPAGFTDTFTSRYVDTGELRLHAVIGGDGPPLLLVHGWPETWYAWRLLMPALARDFEVIAVDQRGMGLSDKPAGGYDTGTLADDLVALMDALGHERFAVVGHDTGIRDQLRAGRGSPGAGRARGPRRDPRAPRERHPRRRVFVPAPINDRLWHIPFNRLERTQRAARHRTRGHLLRLGVRRGRARSSPDDVIDYYVGLLSNPDSLRGSFGFYRALDATIAQDGSARPGG